MIVLFIIIPLLIVYSLLIFYYRQSWNNLPLHVAPAYTPATTVSVIIPARNEAENIGRLLTVLQQQTYPRELFGVIVIDDHSTDDTAAIVQQFAGVTLLQLTDDGINSYKKKAIETGIAAARGELIITTDADCWCGPNWLSTMVQFYEQEKPVFIAAPVSIDCSSRLVEVFQAYDFAVLQGITGASVHRQAHAMCNGANMAYRRDVFYEVEGFRHIDTIASGDDMLLMYKIWTRYPGRVRYLKSEDATMHTRPVTTWKGFINQRIRWASKATHYDDKRILPVLLLVYLFNLSFLVLLILGCRHPVYWLYLAGLWIVKTIVEFPFVSAVTRFFGKQYLMRYFFFFQPLHILYTILAGLFGQFGKYEWKGRKVS
ncbi:MAG: glycosyltransferase [Chitinophagaceae bacterium]